MTPLLGRKGHSRARLITVAAVAVILVSATAVAVALARHEPEFPGPRRKLTDPEPIDAQSLFEGPEEETVP